MGKQRSSTTHNLKKDLKIPAITGLGNGKGSAQKRVFAIAGPYHDKLSGLGP